MPFEPLVLAVAESDYFWTSPLSEFTLLPKPIGAELLPFATERVLM